MRLGVRIGEGCQMRCLRLRRLNYAPRSSLVRCRKDLDNLIDCADNSGEIAGLPCEARWLTSQHMPDVNDEIAAYGRKQKELEEKHMGKWVLFHNGSLVSVYESFEAAAEDAVSKFGRGPYLIRQVGAPALTLPASVMFRPVYG